MSCEAALRRLRLVDIGTFLFDLMGEHIRSGVGCGLFLTGYAP